MGDLALEAFDGSPIPNAIDPDPDDAAVAYAERQFSAALSMAEDLLPPTGRYNCHGLTFGSRRVNIPGPELDYSIWTLLSADAYKRIDTPRVGDIAIWVNLDGEVDHSGIVVEINELGAIFVRSAWGALGEKRHNVNASPYSDCAVEYWRLEV